MDGCGDIHATPLYMYDNLNIYLMLPLSLYTVTTGSTSEARYVLG